MTGPNANPQQNDNTQPDRTSGSAQPEYGSYSSPEFGAMANQYPSDYDPYVYGRPDPPESKKDDGNGAGNQSNANGRNDDRRRQSNQPGGNGQYGQQPYGQNPYHSNPYDQNQYGQQNPYGNNGNPYQQGRAAGWNQQTGGNDQQRGDPDNVDLNDPNQNPLYGHWDVYAILAFVFSFFSVPVLPALMGAVAMWRTRTFHMKGYGLAVAAVVINVIYTIAVIWMMFNGVSTVDLYSSLLGGTGGTGGGEGSLSAMA